MASLRPDSGEPAGSPRTNHTSDPRSQSQSQSQSQPQPEPQPQPTTPETDTKGYYGYLFNKDKSPTHILDALLRAIGQYISANIGDRNVRDLNPKKLAAFYHAVGGDYDSLFINCPYKSISYIWQALGVQHTLQPTENLFEPPSIPALTLSGFVRWETIQILLEPQEHVPFMQFAVRNWVLVHPDTGRPFPVDLPTEAFPTESDPETDAWHKQCARKLRDEATPKDENPPERKPSDPRIRTTFTHVHNPQSNTSAPRHRPEMDYFQRERPVSYAHIPRSNYAKPHFTANVSPPPPPPPQRRPSTGNSARSSVGSTSSSSSNGSPPRPPRRPSYTNTRRPEVEEPRIATHLDPHHQPGPRRHSHSRPYVSHSDSDPDIPSRHSSKSRPQGPIPPPTSIRHMPVVTPVQPVMIPTRPRRSEVHPDDVRRRSLPAEIKQRFASFLSGSNDRHRSTSREKRNAANLAPSVRFRRENIHPRLSRSGSGESHFSDDSDTELFPKYPSRSHHERERLRERVIEKERQKERDREDELDRRSRQERYLRTTTHRRASSHTDIDRRGRDYVWDHRSRDRDTDYDRDTRRVVTADEREPRDRRRYKDRGPSPVFTGVGGRRYPGEPAWK
ncbi:uncharacterized protein GGS25DRAFT_458797 [Hypoxylon fragiforme]|uniref:uncharacterized protein n=1 Tax=Hypoxylon fragiforme TaxID=63214 RepID=UPI0020C5DE04|nr:uncharacterized protein GGS25DRAFT_458797 [Hypoxylon fragiforme]KAI2604382.1 hypothetical protein GGS25DRAFT_458797 [Hypoxylon fragiforme]